MGETIVGMMTDDERANVNLIPCRHHRNARVDNYDPEVVVTSWHAIGDRRVWPATKAIKRETSSVSVNLWENETVAMWKVKKKKMK